MALFDTARGSKGEGGAFRACRGRMSEGTCNCFYFSFLHPKVWSPIGGYIKHQRQASSLSEGFEE